MSVGRICVREVDVADPHESVQVVASRMNSRNVGTLVVLNAENKPIGILTDRDLAIKVVAQGKDPFQTYVADVMTPSPKTVRENTPIERAIEIMRAGPYRRLPVVDAQGQMVGLVSLDDILSLLAEEFKQLGRLVEREGPAVLAKL